MPAIPQSLLRGKHRTELVPPESNRLMANVDAVVEQKVFDLSQREWVTNIHHNREADRLGRAGEILEEIVHRRRLRDTSTWLKTVCSDNAGKLINALKFDFETFRLLYGTIAVENADHGSTVLLLEKASEFNRAFFGSDVNGAER